MQGGDARALPSALGLPLPQLLGKEAPYRAVRTGLYAHRTQRRIDPIDVAALARLPSTYAAALGA